MFNFKKNKFILNFNEITIKDTEFVGGKNASLGEMYHTLGKKGVRIPNGFAITSTAYKYFLEQNKLNKEMEKVLKKLNVNNIRNLRDCGKKIRTLILNAKMPPKLEKEIILSYKKLCKEYGHVCDVAVRSSATAEDLVGASFAGQQETYLNIKGDKQLILACKKCFASLFTDRAISYREEKKFDHMKVYLSVAVQKMVRSDKACSGVMFTIDTESGFDKVVFINAAYGLGENIVQGKVNPDEYYVFKPTLNKYRPIISKRLCDKALKLIYSKNGTKNVKVDIKQRKKYALTDNEVLLLGKWAKIIENHYSDFHKKYTPMDIEWAKDGITGKLFIVQARPETVHSVKKKNYIEQYILKGTGKVIITGDSVGDKIGRGRVRVIKDLKDLTSFRKGEILVTDMTDPDYEPIMKIASGIITDKGGRTSHSAIVSRELGIPCIIGTGNATSKLKNGQKVTIDCSESAHGKIYNGLIDYKINRINVENVPHTRTKVMMNVGIPEQAFELSFFPNDGVGLARMEFIINSYIQIHPLALVNYSKIKDKETKEKIDKLTEGYSNKEEYFIDRLSQGVALIGAAFYPKDVIVRFSDFKSNEYANLIGGKPYEPVESNPMIGWRGASRYYSDYKEGFRLECKAIKKVREEFGLKNVKVMVPFCRTVEEGKRVREEIKKNKLKDVDVYVMAEIPSNILLAEDFCKIFDGFSIGSNDLTQLTLGLDRDSDLVSHLYNERNKAVRYLIHHLISVARRKKKKVGICGDAPSTFPEFTRFLVRCGIDSISLNPDTVLKTRFTIHQEENYLNSKKKK